MSRVSPAFPRCLTSYVPNCQMELYLQRTNSVDNSTYRQWLQKNASAAAKQSMTLVEPCIPTYFAVNNCPSIKKQANKGQY